MVFFPMKRPGRHSCPAFIAAGAAAAVLCSCFRAPYDADPALYNLRLTEIHYHPALDSIFSSDSLGFIELKNTGPSTLDLKSLQFTKGIDYSFPVGATISAGGFYLIAASQNGFMHRYGFAPDGVYRKRLGKNSDTIVLVDALTNRMILSQHYADSKGWPAESDGGGYSLVPVDPQGAANMSGPEAWRPSVRMHGSPGADDLFDPVDSSLFDLRITEIHYHPYDPEGLGGDSLEFIELKNVGAKTLDLEGVAFTKGISYVFGAGDSLEPGGFRVLASNATEFRHRYDTAPFDVYRGQLSNKGEKISIEDVSSGVTIVSVEYADGSPWPEGADGDGYSLVTINRNPRREEQNNPAAWRRSFGSGGSPGRDDPGVVFVNEVLTHTDYPDVDAIELFNPGDADVDIGGWYLTDQRAEPAKFMIPYGTVVGAGKYAVFTEHDFNADPSRPTSFALSEHDEEVYVMADGTGCRGYCHGCGFGSLERGVSLGRYIIPSTGKEVFVPMKDVTLGAENAGPLVGPLIISEIMYLPRDGKSDYIEVSNIGSSEVKLYDHGSPDNTWRINGIAFSFPKAASIKSGESVIVLSDRIDASDFRSIYGVSSNVQIFFFHGGLSDSGSVLKLEKPMEPDKDSTGAIISTTVYYMEYEKVSYKTAAPWPAIDAGAGKSLSRIKKDEYGDDPANWEASQPTPGRFK